MAFEPATALGWRAQWTAALGQRLRAWIEVPDGLSSMARCREFSEQVWPVLEANPGAVLIALGGRHDARHRQAGALSAGAGTPSDQPAVGSAHSQL